MSALIACAGADVIRGEIHLPLRGAWSATLALDTQSVPAGQVTIAADGGLSLTGTVVPESSGAFLDTAHVDIVGGAGGLWTKVGAHRFQNAQSRDVINYIISESGERLSDRVESSVLSVQIAEYAIVAKRASSAFDDICGKIGGVRWRILADGTVWIGEESWPAASLPVGADIVAAYPAERRTVIGVTTPALLPGSNVDGIGKVVGVDHWIEPNQIRTWTWT